MDKKTFSKDITFMSNTLVGTEWKMQPVKKRALFYEFDQSDLDQQEITFRILDLWDFDKKEQLLRAKSKLLAPLMEEIIDVMLLVKDPNNTETKDIESLTAQDIIELKNDNAGLGFLAKWFVRNKIAPFFLNLSESYIL